MITVHLVRPVPSNYKTLCKILVKSFVKYLKKSFATSFLKSFIKSYVKFFVKSFVKFLVKSFVKLLVKSQSKILSKILVLDELPLKSARNRGEISRRITPLRGRFRNFSEIALPGGRFLFRISLGKFPGNLP